MYIKVKTELSTNSSYNSNGRAEKISEQDKRIGQNVGSD